MIAPIDEKLLAKANQLTKELVLDNDKLRTVMEFLLKECELGLRDDEAATVKMFLTYVRNVPSGKEQGQFLALGRLDIILSPRFLGFYADLGGTNFRVLMITLKGDDAKLDSDIYAIPQEIMVGPGKNLFDHIADCLINFIVKHKLESKKLPLGFTFSFPCVQYGLASAKLVTWTKGFDCPDVVGYDVVKLLKEAIKRKGGKKNIFVDVVAIINDTTGTLMSCAHRNRECRVGLIVGTGCNACYMEDLQKIEKWPANYTEPKQVIINTEWGAFGCNGMLDFIRTEYDRKVDENSLNPGRQIYEKMVSGMYIGEILRQALVSLVNAKVLFDGQMPKNLDQKYNLLAKYISRIDTDVYKSYTNTKYVLEKHFAKSNYTVTDLEIIRETTRRVSHRAASLVSAGCAVILNRMERKHTVIGYDGSLLRYHPHYRKWMEEKIKYLIKPNMTFDVMLSEDGSGRGAALVSLYTKCNKSILCLHSLIGRCRFLC